MKQRTLSALSGLIPNLLPATVIALIVSTTSLTATGSITGFVWDDLNTNGIQDAGEPGRDSAWVLLLDLSGNQIASAHTNANGIYTFDSVAAGTYVLRFANPGGIWQTLQDQGGNDAVDSDADPLGYTAQFTIADGQTLDFDAGFTTVPQGCFTPISVTVSAIACDDNGTPDPDDDTFTFAITASGGTGTWGWDLPPNLMMIPYDTAYTFGPFQIVNGVVTFTINDHDNPSCVATVTVTPPMPCSTPLPPDTSSLSIICPNDITATAPQGNTGAVVVFSNPTVTTTCPGDSVMLNQIAGPASGDTFPVGTTEVCFMAMDTCGNADTCCFQITVTPGAPVPTACDVKIIGCIKYELLDITLDANDNKTYRIRVTNNCTNKLIYTAFQLPNGITAKAPLDNSIYTAPSGREYIVRNPNFSPFYSIRFKTDMDSISNGESDIFQYTLPPQADPDYIHVIVRVYPKIFYETHLNTFDCVLDNSPSPLVLDDAVSDDGLAPLDGSEDAGQKLVAETHLGIFPNPSNDFVSADLSAWKGQVVQVSVLNGQGFLIETISTPASEMPFALDVSSNLPNGLYFVEVVPTQGERKVQRFLIQR